MPFVNVKVSSPMAVEQKDELSRAITKAICEILKKPVGSVMVGIEADYDLWLGDEKPERCAFVSVEHKGAGSIVQYNALTEKICEALEVGPGVPSESVYVNFKMVNDWGRGGRIT